MPTTTTFILSSTYLHPSGHATRCRSVDYSEHRASNTYYSSPTCRRFQDYSFRDSFVQSGRAVNLVSQNPWEVSASVFNNYFFRQIPLSDVASPADQQSAVNELLDYVLNSAGLGVAVQTIAPQDILPSERSAQDILGLPRQARMAYCPGFTYLYVGLLNYLNLAAEVVFMPPAIGERVGHLAAMLTLQNSSGQTHYVFDPMVNRNSVLVNPNGYRTLSAREVMAWHLNNRAVNAHNENRPTEARAFLNTAIDLDPQNPYLYANRFLWVAASFDDHHRPNRVQFRNLLSDYHRAIALKPELATELIAIHSRLQGLLRRR